DELGPDAVILSTRKLSTGVEVVAAIDYDESWLDNADAVTSSDGLAPSGGEVPAAPPSPTSAFSSGFDPDVVNPDISFAEALDAAARVRKEGSPQRKAPKRAPNRVTETPVRSTRSTPNTNRSGITPVLERELRFIRGLLENQISSLAWGDFGRRDPARATLIRRLMQLGLTRRVADPIALKAARPQLTDSGEELPEDRVWHDALGTLAQQISVSEHDVLESGGIVALLGPTGVGKTTTIAKLAARFRAAHGADSVALLTTDNYRVGAESQLRTYGQLMGLPVVICGEAQELHDAITRYHKRRLILIDTAGMSQRDIRLVEQVKVIRRGMEGHRRALSCYLVMSAATNHATLDETVRAFAGVDLHGCVLTKVDEATGLGATLSVLIEHQLPITYLCDGQRVPEDLSVARAKQLVVRAVQFASHSTQPPEEALEMMYGGIVAHA
ncbi:MAG: flagellar biosynthesis protein FlhF, partial [Gammaproteobacteria bacterium]